MRAARKQKRPKSVALTAAPLTTSHPTIGVPTLTVGEVASRLSALAPDTPAMIERIRHWTRERLLAPVGQQHGGTGKHRRYAENIVYDTAMLIALADAGMHVASRPYVQDALAQARSALPKWLEDQKRPLFLVVTHYLDPKIEPIVEVRDSAKLNSSAKLTIVINLAQLFSTRGLDGRP
jgi:hypothetical protein